MGRPRKYPLDSVATVEELPVVEDVQKEPNIDPSQFKINVEGVSIAKYYVKGKYYNGHGEFLGTNETFSEATPKNVDMLNGDELRVLIEARGGIYHDRESALDMLLGRK